MSDKAIKMVRMGLNPGSQQDHDIFDGKTRDVIQRWHPGVTETVSSAQRAHERELADAIGCQVYELQEWDICECHSCGLSVKVHQTTDFNGLCRTCGDQIRGNG